MTCIVSRRRLTHKTRFLHPLFGSSLSQSGGERHSAQLITSTAVDSHQPPENPSAVADVHLRPKLTQGTWLDAAWGAIGHLFRLLFVWIFLLILTHLHCKYPWELTRATTVMWFWF